MKFVWKEKVIINSGFYKNHEGVIYGTRKFLWFEREYSVDIYYLGEEIWHKESHLTKDSKC